MTKRHVIGHKFNYLTILEDYGRYILCICDCGVTKQFEKSNVLTSHTKSCGCYNAKLASQRAKNGTINKTRAKPRPTELIIYEWWAQLIRGAKNRNLEFTITPEYLTELFYKQSGRCIYTNLEISMPKDSLDRRNSNYSASLDRIDSSKGYVEGNVQWVHKTINLMKMSLTEAEFLCFCNLVSNQYPDADLSISEQPRRKLNSGGKPKITNPA